MNDRKKDIEHLKAKEDAYTGVIDRLEPNITMIDRDAALASIAISLKRIADTLQNIEIILFNIENNQ